MLNLNVIVDDSTTGVYCETVEQVQELTNAIKEQRPDIDIDNWVAGLTKYHCNRVYLLNYCNSKRLQFGSIHNIKALNLNYIQFSDLIMDDLPDFETNPDGALALLGIGI